jgi:MauM/NapG family ferredoxin protein
MSIGILRWLRRFVNPPKPARLDLSRRAVLGAGVVGLSSGYLLHTHPLAGRKTFSAALIRPPGSLAEADFLAKCVRCGECMKVCPTNAIHPATFEGGLDALWSPVMKMNIGYCEYECTLCTQVCPTGAIREMPVPEKQKVRIGLAYFDRNRCLPYAYSRTCIVCEEHCPTPKKAIWFEEVQVLNARGDKVTVKQPRIDAELCIGCGICEAKCPLKDQAGVRCTSAGESRNSDNKVLLNENEVNAGSPY